MRIRSKTVILILARTFSRRHHRAGQETRFAESVTQGTKIHTIRSDYDLWSHNIDKVRNGNFFLSLRQWQGESFRSKHIEVKELKTTVGYERIILECDPDTRALTATINGTPYHDIELLAHNEGLTYDDFVDWFFGQGIYRTRFKGIIVHFTDFRYNSNLLLLK